MKAGRTPALNKGMTMEIKAFGKTHRDEAAAKARISELRKVNAEIGASDDRITEILTIEDALIDAKERRNQLRVNGLAAAARARKTFANADKGKGMTRSIYYTDIDGKDQVAYYETEFGFEVGYARLVAAGNAINAAG
jgi:hypothetical protein